MSVCWKCLGEGTVEEPVCCWCEEGLNHGHCDDSWYRRVKCDVCDKEEEVSTFLPYFIFWSFFLTVVAILLIRNYYGQH